MGHDSSIADRSLPLRSYLALGLALVALGCGKRGDPLPPLRPTPQPVTGLAIAQRGDELTIDFVAPRAATDGARLPVLDIELLRLEGEGDFTKTAKATTQKAAPGEHVHLTEALPAAGTRIRLAARAVQRDKKSVQTSVVSIVIQAAPPAPTGLVAKPGPVGVTLAWSAPDPMPCWVEPAPAPSPAPRLPGAFPPPQGARPPLPPGAPAPTTPQAPPAPPTPVPAPSASPNPAASPSPAPSPSPTPVPMPPRVGGFRVYRRADPGSFAAALQAVPTESSSYDDLTAALGSRVCYVVRTVVSTDPLVESDASNEVCLSVTDVTAPAAPTGLTTLSGEGGVDVSWSPSAEPDLASYRIYRGAREGRTRVGEVTKPTTTFRDATAAPGQRYRYTVTAVDAAGNESPPSPAVEVAR